MTKKLIIFDFDGTLSDYRTIGAKILAEFSVLHNLPYDQDKLNIGYIDPLTYDLGWGLSLEEQPLMLKKFEEYGTDVIAVQRRYVFSLFDGVKEALDVLKTDYDMGIVTARDRASFLAIIEQNGIADYFDFYRSACCMHEKGKAIKPSSDAIYCILEQFPYALQNIVVVGDTSSDVHMAHNAGVKSIGVTWGLHPREKIASANPTMLLDRVSDLPSAVANVFSR